MYHLRHKGRLLGQASIAGFVALAGGAASSAAEVTIVPKLEVREVYNDNVFLDDSGTDDFITSVKPGLSIEAVGNRLSARANYDLGLLYFKNEDEFQTRHNGQAALRYQVIERNLAIEATASVSEQFGARGGGVSSSQFNLTENRGTLQTYNVGPRLNLRFQDKATFSASYNFRVSQSDFAGEDRPALAGNLANGTGHSAQAELASGSALGKVRVSAFGSFSQFNRRRPDGVQANFQNFRNSQAGGRIQVPVNRQFILTGEAGYFESTAQNLFGNGEGLFWNAGFQFRGRRTSLSFNGGQRDNATVFNGSLQYELGTRFNVSAGYVDQFQSNQALILDETAGLIDGLPGTGNDLTDPGPIPGFTLSDRDFRNRRGSVSLNYQRERLSGSVTGFYNTRDFDTAGTARQADGYGGTVQASYEVSRQSRINGSFTYRFDGFEGGARDDDLYFARAGYERTLSNYLVFGVDYSLTKRESTSAQPFAEFTENVVSVFLRGTF